MPSRRCKTCGLTFATPDSIRIHKRDGICRSPEVLRAIGWRETPRGWRLPLASAPKPEQP